SGTAKFSIRTTRATTGIQSAAPIVTDFVEGTRRGSDAQQLTEFSSIASGIWARSDGRKSGPIEPSDFSSGQPISPAFSLKVNELTRRVIQSKVYLTSLL
ncbi:MAG: hypothetical protein ACREDR_29655, partial [Blastocatellia bacterium]